MKLRNYLLIQNILIVLVSITISGLALIQMSYSFHLKEEVKNLFREGKNIETNIRDIYIPGLNLENSNRFSFISDIETQLKVMGNFFYKWDIHFRFYDSGEEIYNSSESDGKAVFGKYIYKKVYVIKTVDDKTILYIGFPAFVDYENIFLVVEKDITHVKRNKYRQMLILFMIILFFSIILLPLSYIISRKVTDPIYGLINHIKNFHNGDSKLSRRYDFKEIEFLYNNFEQLKVDILKKIKLLEEESVNKEKFLGKLNHEINTPISSIYGFSDLLLKSPYDEETYNKCLFHIKNESYRLKDLNKNLQKLFLPSDNYLWKEVHITEIINDVLSSLEFLIREKGLDIQVSISSTTVKANPDLLHTLLRNIIHNAIKASYQNGRVEIADQNNRDKYLITIKDFGVGIKDEDLTHISELYYTGNNQNYSDKGSGIGLDICREILQHHNSSIEFRKNSDAGTTVILDFTTILQISDNSIKSEV